MELDGHLPIVDFSRDVFPGAEAELLPGAPVLLRAPAQGPARLGLAQSVRKVAFRSDLRPAPARRSASHPRQGPRCACPRAVPESATTAVRCDRSSRGIRRMGIFTDGGPSVGTIPSLRWNSHPPTWSHIRGNGSRHSRPTIPCKRHEYGPFLRSWALARSALSVAVERQSTTG